MSALVRWNDERLDDLNDRLKKVEAVPTDVAVMKQVLEQNTSWLSRLTRLIESLDRKIDAQAQEPLTRARDLRRQLALGAVCAFGGGVATFVGAIAAGVLH